MTKRGWLLFLALGVIWGMPYLLIRIAVESIDPLVVAIILGVLFLHEPLTLGMAIGFPLVIVGSILGTARVAAR